MIISQEQLITIVESLSKIYGHDIAHDVALALLKRRNPLVNPKTWASAYAAALSRREKSQWRTIKIIYECNFRHGVTIDSLKPRPTRKPPARDIFAWGEDHQD